MVAMSELTSDPDLAAVHRVAAGAPMDAYDYGLPDHLIAQEPIEPRSAARLLVGPGLTGDGVTGHATVADLPRPVATGRRGGGQRDPGAARPAGPGQGHRGAGRGAPARTGGRRRDVWEALVRPGRRLPDPALLFESVVRSAGGRGRCRPVGGRGRSAPGEAHRPHGGGAGGHGAAPALHPPRPRTIPTATRPCTRRRGAWGSSRPPPLPPGCTSPQSSSTPVAGPVRPSSASTWPSGSTPSARSPPPPPRST